MISTIILTTDIASITQIMTYSIISVFTLITVLALKEILTTESYKNKRIHAFIQGATIATIPLLTVFLSIINYKIKAFI